MNFSCAIPGTNRTIPFTNKQGPISEKYPVELSEWQINQLRSMGFTVNVLKEVKPTVEGFQKIEALKKEEEAKKAALKKAEVVEEKKDEFDKFAETLPVNETPLKEEVVEAIKEEGEEIEESPKESESDGKAEYDELNKLETKDLKKILYADLKLGTSGDRDMLIKRIIKARKEKK